MAEIVLQTVNISLGNKSSVHLLSHIEGFAVLGNTSYTMSIYREGLRMKTL
jgi:hypothetical protein